MKDFGQVIGAGTVRFERLLPGPIERVWSFLTESEQRATWLAGGEMDLHPGGRVELVFRNSSLTPNDDPAPPKYADMEDEAHMQGRVIACDPPRLLTLTWAEASGNDSEVTFELTPEGAKTRLVLTHRRLDRRDDMLSVAGGWHTHLGILADRLAGREPEGFWRTHTRLEREYERIIPAEVGATGGER